MNDDQIELAATGQALKALLAVLASNRVIDSEHWNELISVMIRDIPNIQVESVEDDNQHLTAISEALRFYKVAIPAT
ncbi:hypothetical protein [Devosia beringensis]|uniref:hypothetical protein n=1 Tax=Devosia beringensis TaxID=2657486 RepID=UPI00186B6699|nr:hypothetical protein [Devosia beringensis]